MATRLQKSMLQPITVIFKFLTTKTRVVIWLYEQPATRIEGRLLGFGALRSSARRAGGAEPQERHAVGRPRSSRSQQQPLSRAESGAGAKLAPGVDTRLAEPPLLVDTAEPSATKSARSGSTRLRRIA